MQVDLLELQERKNQLEEHAAALRQLKDNVGWKLVHRKLVTDAMAARAKMAKATTADELARRSTEFMTYEDAACALDVLLRTYETEMSTLLTKLK